MFSHVASRGHAFALVAVLTLVASISEAQTVIYVRQGAPPGGDGATWETAFNRLDDAIELGEYDGPVEFWVALGTYTPAPPGGNRNEYFQAASGMRFLGGFAGFETSADQRRPDVYVTVLSGDLNGDDLLGFVNRSDNSHSIMYAFLADSDETTLEVDGFVFTGSAGAADDGANCALVAFFTYDGLDLRNCTFIENEGGSGGAVFAGAQFGGFANFENCLFAQNRGVVGGAVYTVRGAYCTLRGCTFEGNKASAAGGGFVADHTNGVFMENCRFERNQAPIGGAAYVVTHASSDIVILSRCEFVLNTASDRGGALANLGSTVNIFNSRFFNNHATAAGGALFANTYERLPGRYRDALARVANSLFTGNSAEFNGAAMYLTDTGPGATTNVRVASSTVAHNQCAGRGGGVRADNTAQLALANSVLWGNGDSGGMDESAQLDAEGASLSIGYSDVQGWTGALGGPGNFGADPRFVQPAGPDGSPGTPDDDLRVRFGSPLIDAGSNAEMPADIADLDGDGDIAEALPRDLAEFARFRDEPSASDSGSGSPPLVDMGAFEFRPIGDMNCDSVVNAFDIDPFVLALVTPEAYENEFPLCAIANGDIDGDGAVTNFDIDPFVDLLIGG
ncbi:MAG: right-handed parallel beta-helix repeat-containing protein [Phycisphaerales bacterium]|nr:right-handed parallel beta-helix repeat-containing protein [Phycisphaerales bacterium]